jgi:hypothetical protein
VISFGIRTGTEGVKPGRKKESESTSIVRDRSIVRDS